MALRADARKQARWLDLVQRWQRSKLTIREFCRRHQLREANFHAWRRVLRERGLMDEAPAPADAQAFVKLTIAAEPRTASAVEVILGARVLRVRPGFDAVMLRELVRLLEEPAC